MFPFLVTVNTTGQHKRSTTKMLQIEFLSDQKSQHTAMLKSENMFSTTPAEAPWCHQHRHGLSKQSSNGTCFVQALHYKVVLGSTLCKLCTGNYSVQALKYKVVTK